MQSYRLHFGRVWWMLRCHLDVGSSHIEDRVQPADPLSLDLHLPDLSPLDTSGWHSTLPLMRRLVSRLALPDRILRHSILVLLMPWISIHG